LEINTRLGIEDHPPESMPKDPLIWANWTSWVKARVPGPVELLRGSASLFLVRCCCYYWLASDQLYVQAQPVTGVAAVIVVSSTLAHLLSLWLGFWVWDFDSLAAVPPVLSCRHKHRHNHRSPLPSG